MRIAFLSPSGQMGGAETCLIDALAVLREARPSWKCEVVLGEDGPLAKRAREHGAETHLLPFPTKVAQIGDSGQGGRTVLALRLASAAPSVLRYRFQLRKLLRRIAPDIIHTNGFKMHVLGALAKPPRMALVWHIHDYISTRSLMSGLMRRLAGRSDTIMTNSHHVAEDTRTIVGQSADIVPVLNVVDLQEFTPSGPTLDLDGLADLGPAPNGTIRVGLLATLAWWKGHRLFLKGLATLDPGVPVRGYYIGGALYRTHSQESLEELQSFAHDLGIVDRVGFTGVVSEPAGAMRALDIVVHASTEPEPFGRVIVEAMATGKPVITTALGGAAEIVRLGDFALQVDTEHPASLAAAISKLATDRSLREHLGNNGLQVARRHFGRERLAQELPAVYEEVLSRVHGSKSSRTANG